MPDPRQQRRLLVGLLIAATVLQLPNWTWLVEDAAITYSFARNLADGFGVVAFPGGERVEGYSNPLWMAIQAVLIWLGGDPFVLEPWLGWGLGLATVGVVYVWGRGLSSWETGPIAAFIVALSAQHAIWAQGGLENGLFSLLLALGGWRLTVGGDDDRLPPLLFLALTLTRPEGLAYALVAGLVSICTADSLQGACRRMGAWIAWFALPLALYQGLRFAYFAAELPATFYAKIGERSFDPLQFDGRAWKQLRAFVMWCGLAPFVPLLPLAASGIQGPRSKAGLMFAAVLAVALLPWPGIGRWRAAVFIGVFTVVPLLALGNRDRRAQLAAAGLLWCGLLFCLRSGGDWMVGFRFMSMLVVPAAMLFATSVAELYRIWSAQSRPATGRPSPFVVMAMLYAVGQLVSLIGGSVRRDITPYAIGRRVEHYAYLAEKVDLDRTVIVSDSDLGGNMWWGAHQLVVRDPRGLVDLPFALHGARGRIAQEELGMRTPPDFAHVHGSSGVAMRRFRKRGVFVDVPGYPAGSLTPHGAQTVRRSLFLDRDRPDSPVAASFTDPGTGEVVAELMGVRVESPDVARHSGLFVEVGLGAPAGRDFRVVAFLHRQGQVAASWDLPPAYGWVSPESWAPDEIFHGRYALRLPEGAPRGTYDLGLALFTPEGQGLLPHHVEHATAPTRPTFARGEVVVPDAVQLVSRPAMIAATAADLATAWHLAGDERCEQAETFWTRARHHSPLDPGVRSAFRAALAPEMAACWARRGRGNLRNDALLDRVRDLQRGRAWDPASPEVERACHRVSAKAWQRGLEARQAHDPQAAYRWFTASVEADPTKAWARRYAEQARVARWEAAASRKAAPQGDRGGDGDPG